MKTAVKSVLVFILLVLLTACAKTSGVTVLEEYETVVEPNQFSLTLLEGRQYALLNGEKIDLTAAPVMQNGSFYIPLQELVKLLGGSYSYADETASVCLFDHICVFRLNNAEVTADDVSYPVGETVDGYVPIVLNEQVYIPDKMLDLPGCHTSIGGLGKIAAYPDSGMIILGDMDFHTERRVGEIELYDTYANLSADVSAQFELVGTVGEVLNYSVVEYRSDKMSLYVMEAKGNGEDQENMDGKICSIRVFQRGIPTARGLEVGDSPERAWQLYGSDYVDATFAYSVNGHVEEYIIHSRYYRG